MTHLITDTYFGPDPFSGVFLPLETWPADTRDVALDLSPETCAEALRGRLENVTMIRVDFPHFADGRGFSLARALRRGGYQGRLRAKGHVIADQYAMARGAGFDEVEIPSALAKRHFKDHWIFRAQTWRQHDFQARLMARA